MPGQLLGATSHSHIRIVPRADYESTGNRVFYEHNLPTFRSPSLQFPPPSSRESRRGSAQSDASASGTTFADMARRFHQSDHDGIERPTSGPVPLAGYIQLKSARNRQGNKTWRTPEPNNLGIDQGLGVAFDADASSSPADFGDLHSTPETSRLSPVQLRKPRCSPFDLPAIQTKPNNAAPSQSVGSTRQQYEPQEGDESISPTDTRFNVNVMGDYARVFGRLPDLIHLHEQTGDFDGQIVFIGHPNRDVSVHQWSSAVFQWVNIGVWSHMRCQIEGAIASDSVPNCTLDPKSIEYFKEVALIREDLIKRYGREQDPKDPTEGPSTLADGGTTSVQFTTVQSPTVPLPIRTNGHHDHRSSIHSTSRNVTREHLDDPFVTPAKPQQPAVPMPFDLGVGKAGGLGSIGTMNFNYQFPVKSTLDARTFGSQHTNTSLHQVYAQREHERLEVMRRGNTARDTPTHLRDIGFGEEAASSFSTPVARAIANQLPGPLSPEDVLNRLQLKNKLSELGTQTRRSTLPGEQRIAIPEVTMQNHNIRTLFPPGPTVANGRRGAISNLNATAAPYTRGPTTVQRSDASESELVTSMAALGPKLHFSDPDGVRQDHVHEIANGLDQQAPTRQNFHGPFFADSKPTANNPTATLAVSVAEEERLVNWFRDGQRPARQQDYARSLMVAAWGSNKERNLGAIGEGSSPTQDETMYENTPVFARVYENLLQYAEESRSGTRDCFTHAWKPAAPHLRDTTAEGKGSLFASTSAALPQLERAPVRPIAPLPDNTRGKVGRKTNTVASKRTGRSDRWATGGW
ncbi:hypothetical protein CC80DRAFT_171224 [Byssothecium circinans]|uniref:Uncharacterized protein n=1 Tax=Byssothecium circinans TaxID=147558 RepID=A0A6A5TLK7_9PLEO|nr:hypothetical protein CC80DRAFT_171224 [Byssothecium circinans]